MAARTAAHLFLATFKGAQYVPTYFYVRVLHGLYDRMYVRACYVRPDQASFLKGFSCTIAVRVRAWPDCSCPPQVLYGTF